LAARGGWAVLGGEGGGLGRRVGGGREVLERVAATFALSAREPVGGALFVLGLAGVEGVGDAGVAGDEGGGGEQRDRGQSGQAAPAAGEVVGGASPASSFLGDEFVWIGRVPLRKE